MSRAWRNGIVAALLASAPLAGQPPGWPGHAPSHHTCHVTLAADPMEVLEAMADDPGVVRAVRTGPVANLIKVLTGLRDTHPRLLLPFARMIASRVPTRFGVAWKPGTGRALAAWVRLALAGGLLASDREADGPLRDRWLSEAAAALRAGMDVELSMWTRARTTRTAEQWFDGFLDAVEELARETTTEALEVVSQDSKVEVTVVPVATRELERELRERVAAALGVPAADARLRKMGDLLLGWSLRCEVRLEGADLLTVLRSVPRRGARAPRARTSPSDLLPPEPAEGVILRAAFEVAPIREGLDRLLGALWRSRDSLRAGAGPGWEEDLAVALRHLRALLAGFPEDRTAGWLAATTAGLSWRGRAVTGKVGLGIEAAPSLRLLPPRDVASLEVNGRAGIAAAAAELPWLGHLVLATSLPGGAAVQDAAGIAVSAATEVFEGALESRPWARLVAMPAWVTARARTEQGVRRADAMLAGEALIARLASGRRGVAVGRALFERLGEALDADPRKVHEALERRGLAALQGCCVELDPETPSLRLLPRGAFDDRDAGWIPYRWSFGAIVLGARIGRVENLPA